MNLGRRGLLKIMAATPAAASLAPAMAVQAGGYGVTGLMAAGGALSNAPPKGIQWTTVSSTPRKTFKAWADWLADEGDDLRGRAKAVSSIDPDIAGMCVPLQTKVHWQRERNYRALLAEKKSWFEESLSRDGEVKVW